jgi:putative redox protein
VDATLTWTGDALKFDAKPALGPHFFFDSEAEAGPSPMQGLLCSLAACTAMDVISILEKKRQKVTSYRVEIHAERPEEGTYPRPFQRIRVKHIFEGESLEPAAIERAIELSHTKYCSVTATLEFGPEVTNEWQVNSPTN